MGEIRASVNTIRILQSILGVPECSDEALAGKDVAALQAMIESLRQQIANRPQA